MAAVKTIYIIPPPARSTRTIVSRLQTAWEYHTGDADSNSQIQVNSIIVDSTLYGVSPRLKIFALDAATGRLKWSFDPARPDGGVVQKIAINACRE